MKRLASILCLCLALTSCESLWLSAYRHQGGYKATESEHQDNLRWMRAHYLDVPLTRALNAPPVPSKTAQFEQPSLLPITYHGEERYQQVEPWGFPYGDRWIVVPKGIVVDGASVPRACWSFMPRDGRHRAGALAHDYSYQTTGHLAPDLTITRQQADAMLRDMMERAGCGSVTANIVYAAVRVAGGSSWGSHAPIILPVEHRMYAPRFLPPRTFSSHIYAP